MDTDGEALAFLQDAELKAQVYTPVDNWLAVHKEFSVSISTCMLAISMQLPVWPALSSVKSLLTPGMCCCRTK